MYDIQKCTKNNTDINQRWNLFTYNFLVARKNISQILYIYKVVYIFELQLLQAVTHC